MLLKYLFSVIFMITWVQNIYKCRMITSCDYTCLTEVSPCIAAVKKINESYMHSFFLPLSVMLSHHEA